MPEFLLQAESHAGWKNGFNWHKQRGVRNLSQGFWVKPDIDRQKHRGARFHPIQRKYHKQRRYLFTTRSKEQSSKGRFSASPWNKSIFRPMLSALCFAFSSMHSEKSMPVTSCRISEKRRARKQSPILRPVISNACLMAGNFQKFVSRQYALLHQSHLLGFCRWKTWNSSNRQ